MKHVEWSRWGHHFGHKVHVVVNFFENVIGREVLNNTPLTREVVLKPMRISCHMHFGPYTYSLFRSLWPWMIFNCLKFAMMRRNRRKLVQQIFLVFDNYAVLISIWIWHKWKKNRFGFIVDLPWNAVEIQVTSFKFSLCIHVSFYEGQGCRDTQKIFMKLHLCDILDIPECNAQFLK